MTPPPLRAPSEAPSARDALPLDARPSLPSEASSRTPLGLIAFAGLVAIVYLAWNVAVGLLLGVVLAFVADPVFRRVERLLRGRTRVASMLTTTTVLAMMAAGTAVAVWVIASETLGLAVDVQHRAATAPLDALVGRGGVRLIDALHVPRAWVLNQSRVGASRVEALAAPIVSGVVASTGSGLIAFVITLATMYYALFQWGAASRHIEALVPIRPRYTRVLLDEFRVVGRGALVGTLGTATVQGLFGVIGYTVAGVPRPALLGVATALLGFLPVGGTMLVWAPATLYLLAVNRNAAAAVHLAWSVVVVVMVSDYVIRPRLVGSASPVHPLFVLVALLGGVETFGLWGVLIGPVLMSVCVAALRLYETEFAPMRGVSRECEG